MAVMMKLVGRGDAVEEEKDGDDETAGDEVR